MKQRLQGIVIGVLICLLVANSVTFAESITQKIDVVYNNIKIFIDGAEYVAKDANGNVVNPFVYNGTTYLPVRGIANAFGKDVVWDGKTASIYLGKKDQNQPDNYLDRIQYSYYNTYSNYLSGRNNFWVINGEITDQLKNTYKNGLLFQAYGNRPIANDPDNALTEIDYPLNGLYSKLNGKIVLPGNVSIVGTDKKANLNTQSNTCNIIFYGDGREIYKANTVTSTMPFSFDIDVAGVNTLKIKIVSNQNDDTYIALTGLALYK